MSTMLKTAAMSILSKTLQTFLYKYLLDVDVEGVAMPSFMDADGHSGWGVRLCNVRLREGVELVTLPGKRKVKRRKPKEPKSEATSSEEEEIPNESTEANESRTNEVVSNGTAQPSTSVIEEAGVKDSERGLIQPDYFSDDGAESDVSEEAQSRGYSLACFHRSSSAANHTGNDVVSLPSVDRLPKEKAANQPRQIPVGAVKSGSTNETGRIAGTFLEKDQDQKRRDSTEPVSDEEFVEVEKDMILRLGNGGRIGVLDVR